MRRKEMSKIDTNHCRICHWSEGIKNSICGGSRARVSKKQADSRFLLRRCATRRNDKSKVVAARLVGMTKTKGAANFRSLLQACTLPQVLAELNYWLSGLKVRTPASVKEHFPAGSTRTTESSSAQKPRIPVWLIVIGVALIV